MVTELILEQVKFTIPGGSTMDDRKIAFQQNSRLAQAYLWPIQPCRYDAMMITVTKVTSAKVLQLHTVTGQKMK